MIYVPDTENYECFVIQNENVLRAYEEIPRNNKTINYRDYYYNSNYVYRDGSQTFSQYATLPICLSNNDITTDTMYRNDYDSILIIFTIMFLFIVYFPLKILFCFFRRFNI